MNSDYSGWLGRSESRKDILEPLRTNALSAAIGEDANRKAGDALPPLHHWLYSWDVRGPDQLGTDGHPARGGFLPPVPLPRRMWAGGRLRFHKPLIIGGQITRTSTILSVETKSGRSGELVFVTVRHVLSGADGVALEEEQDIVYRAASAPDTPAPTPGTDVPPTGKWHRTIQPDPVLLFRYSALTMNGHRIHFDRPYAMDEEGYPALVVHGPLQATLLASLATRKLHASLKSFEFRGQAPAFDCLPLHICGEPSETGARLWTEQAGARTMVASAA